MKFFPLKRLEKITGQGLADSLSIKETDRRILKTLGLLRASNKLYGNPFFAKWSTWYLDEGDIGPSQRIVDCEQKFVQNLKNNSKYTINVNVPFKVTSAFGRELETAEEVTTITYSSASGKQGNPFQAELDALEKPDKIVNKIFRGIHIKKLVGELRAFKIIHQAYNFDTVYKEANR